MSRFIIGTEDFLLDGQPHRILSGAIHYFRVHPDHWTDRIHKARQMGLNTIETYVPWSLHAPQPDEWTATGPLDLDRFLRAVDAEGMHAIVRPGPYICAEFHNGGLPTWLLQDQTIPLRTSDPRFLGPVQDYLAHVTSIVAPLQIDSGGPVILMQVENEYGAYGDDAAYLDALIDMTRRGGITVPLISVDQPEPGMLEAGSTPRLHTTASFGSRSLERLEVLREHQPSGPLMCGEYWNGWFDSWGTHHHTTSAADSAADLDQLLSTGASVNLYMFHGGTNFGLTSGANDKGTYVPIATSYDYDAPLNEAGAPTAKYWAYRDVLARYGAVPEDAPPTPASSPTGSVQLTERWSLLDVLRDRTSTESMEVPQFPQVSHDTAFLHHEIELHRPSPSVLTVEEVRDRLTVVCDGNVVGVLSRDHHERAITLPPIRSRLELVVEELGGVNYGPRLGEPKGVIGPVRIDGDRPGSWRTTSISERMLSSLPPRGTTSSRGGLPALTLAEGDFEVEEVTDRFLDTSGLGRGIAWINGFCLGRYWSRGPQTTLYVPAPILRVGTNQLRVLELQTAPSGTVRFVAQSALGHTEY